MTRKMRIPKRTCVKKWKLIFEKRGMMYLSKQLTNSFSNSKQIKATQDINGIVFKIPHNSIFLSSFDSSNFFMLDSICSNPFLIDNFFIPNSLLGCTNRYKNTYKNKRSRINLLISL